MFNIIFDILWSIARIVFLAIISPIMLLVVFICLKVLHFIWSWQDANHLANSITKSSLKEATAVYIQSEEIYNGYAYSGTLRHIYWLITGILLTDTRLNFLLSRAVLKPYLLPGQITNSGIAWLN